MVYKYIYCFHEASSTLITKIDCAKQPDILMPNKHIFNYFEK